jgi:signal transduction histidine kinase
MIRKTPTAVLLSAGILGLFFSRAFSADSPQSKEEKQIVALVDKAAALIANKGKFAFPEFKKKDSEWRTGETYVFILDTKGTTLMHSVSPELETKNTIDLKDANGKAFIREFLATAQKGPGWVEYMLPKPGKKEPSKKKSYVRTAKLPSGETVVVGAGLYLE